VLPSRVLKNRSRRALLFITLWVGVSGCPSSTEPPPLPPTAATFPGYDTHVKRVLDARCVSCHSCYNAPCQLNLASYEGVERGANEKVVYEPSRAEGIAPTRMFVDAKTTHEWATRFGFFPVLARTGSGERNLSESILYRLIQQRDVNTRLPRLDPTKNHACPQTVAAALKMLAAEPEGGMPYGLPPLSKGEREVFEKWIAAGAPGPAQPEALHHAAEVARWEAFFNAQGPKERLTARYLFEHLSIAHLAFSPTDREFYRLVRSRTAAPQPIDELATVRPYDDPKAPFFYRLRPLGETVVAKTHVPYLLSEQRLARLQELFLVPKWAEENPAFPSWEPSVASNPFVAFAAIPPASRYQFMLDDAYYHVRSFIHGPVCKGRVALDVIDEHFFIFFLDPKADIAVTQPRVLDETKALLELPAEGDDGPKAFYERFQVAELRYLKKRAELTALLDKRGRTLDDLWKGEVLTVYRHFDSATVTAGAIGGVPKTAWVMDYPIFERMFYDLVAGFNVFGNAVHQISTRRYMDSLRMESEDGFLRFLPKAQRPLLRRAWYRGTGVETLAGLEDPLPDAPETQVKLSSADPKTELLSLIAPVKSATDEVEQALRRLATIRGGFVRDFPDVALVQVGQRVYSLIHNKEHLNVSFMFLDDAYRAPDEDTLHVVPGLVGSYPNQFFVVNEDQVGAFVEAVQTQPWTTLLNRFGVGRGDPRFWGTSDAMNTQFLRADPLHAGVLDLTRYGVE
jgi:hypothetical protein